MYIAQYNRKTSFCLIFIFTCIILLAKTGKCQTSGMYPPFTKWHQDPLGLKPVKLSTAFGFVWASATTAACLIFTKNDSLFRKKISAYSENGYTLSYKPPYTRVLQSDVGFIYEVRRWMSLGLGWNTFHFIDQVNDTWTFGIMPFTRWHIYKSKKTAFFFQYGAGISYSQNRFPLTGTGWETDTGRVGTKFNLMSKYGVGAEFHLTKTISLQASVKHFHLSNGNIAGILRNPSHDSNGFFFGIIYKPD